MAEKISWLGQWSGYPLICRCERMCGQTIMHTILSYVQYQLANLIRVGGVKDAAGDSLEGVRVGDLGFRYM